MPQITVTLDLSTEALVELITRSATTRIVDFKAGAAPTPVDRAAFMKRFEKPRRPVKAPDWSHDDLEAFFDLRGNRLSTGKRPTRLNIKGMEAVWNAYRAENFSIGQLTEALNSGPKYRIHRATVARLIQKIKAAKKGKS